MKSLRTIIRYMAPYWVPALLAPLSMALEVAMDLAQPRLLQNIVDDGIANNDLRYVVHTGLIMVAAGIIGLLAGAACTIFATIAGLNFGADLRGAVFRKIQSFSSANLDRIQTGKLITRLTSDVDQVQEASLMLMRIMVRAPLLAIGGLVMAILTAPGLSLIIVIITPLVIAALVITSKRAFGLFLGVQERLDKLNIILQENLAGVRLVKAFVREQHECSRFGTANEDLMGQTVRASTLVAGVTPAISLLVNAGVVAVIWFGGWEVNRGQLHVGQLLAFTNYLTQMFHSLVMVGMLVMRMSQADASTQRIAEVLETQPDVTDCENPADPPAPTGRLEFDSVLFGYDGDEAEPVLRGVSLTAEPGQTVAIVGATGCGKSSLVNLVPRLYDVQGGCVRVDGVDVRELKQADLRRHIGMVMQETVLFSGSIRDNIAYARPEATDEEVEQAARTAQAHDFIMSLPDGYATELGQRGVNLSGGQKQRLAIARALLCKPSILILDDCSSAVDAATESRIMAALDEAPDPCTRLIVAQRIGSILAADRILVLEDGAIAAEGTHRELLETSPAYRDIVRSQVDPEVVAGV